MNQQNGTSGTGAAYAVADREGFSTVYPDAIEKRWSYGRPITAPMPTLAGEPVDDTGFIRVQERLGTCEPSWPTTEDELLPERALLGA